MTRPDKVERYPGPMTVDEDRPYDEIDEEDRVLFALRTVLSLTPREHQVMRMYYVLGCNGNDIASKLKISRDSVRVYWHRAIKKMRRL